ncbi:type III secretion system effector inositol phosphate phosphatase [Chitinimonas sp. BJB300]|uniref:type III secretion system effector inositol phosphate phosphatase n=1 Tax=Chitinimonas sp. BJB300 TaxID=1559339 RepID=UPI0013043FAE|nr:type III secretion system effector inositol phosphate phosphatase [Chitinimonas sp. BJB300]
MLIPFVSTPTRATQYEVANTKAASSTQLGNANIVAGSAVAPKKIEVMHTPHTLDIVSRLKQFLGLEQPPLSTASSRSLHTLLGLQRYQINAAQQALSNLGLASSTDALALGSLSRQLDATALLKTDREATRTEVRRNKQLGKDLTNLIANAFKREGIPSKEALREAKAAFAQARLEVLNSKSWETIETKFEHGGRAYVSTQMPASQMKLGDRDIFPSCYASKGVCSGSTKEATHAANLWASEIRGDDGQVLHKGVRHGILSPYGLSDRPVERQQGALNRAREVVTAALFSQPATLQRALQGEVVGLRLTSTSLVTPGLGSEGKMLHDQITAWRTLTDQPQPMSLQVRNEAGELCTVKLNLKLAAFNFGVNELALKFKLGQKQSDEYNLVAMHQLLGNDLRPDAAPGGWVGEYLQDNPHNRDRVLELARQLKTIWADKSHHKDGGEPYKGAQRVAMLAFEIGAVSCSNCKSGKDRTGMLDAELKREAVAQHLGRGLSQPGSGLNETNRTLMQQVLLHSGNLEIQAYNTGAPGNKVMKTLPVSLLNLSYAKRIGNPEIWMQTQGLSGLVKS